MMDELKQKILKFLGARDEKGLLALFDHPEKLLDAVKKVRELHLKDFEAYTPFPVHGLEKAMGLKRSWIPWATLFYGLLGAGLLFYFQTWTMAIDWPMNIGGKPFFSWPAYIPITFEGMVLLGGVLTVVTLFATLKLPNMFRKPLDPRLTNDMFGLWVGYGDPHFDGVKLNNLFKECDAEEIKIIK
ncbi:MAG: DUF3341 domain-containing protein [Deltaproteobacteria bacterium]|nr:DUF3341 domain-containing protein [Deltaproteobacteria bacterium]